MTVLRRTLLGYRYRLIIPSFIVVKSPFPYPISIRIMGRTLGRTCIIGWHLIHEVEAYGGSVVPVYLFTVDPLGYKDVKIDMYVADVDVGTLYGMMGEGEPIKVLLSLLKGIAELYLGNPFMWRRYDIEGLMGFYGANVPTPSVIDSRALLIVFDVKGDYPMCISGHPLITARKIYPDDRGVPSVIA